MLLRACGRLPMAGSPTSTHILARRNPTRIRPQLITLKEENLDSNVRHRLFARFAGLAGLASIPHIPEKQAVHPKQAPQATQRPHQNPPAAPQRRLLQSVRHLKSGHQRSSPRRPFPDARRLRQRHEHHAEPRLLVRTCCRALDGQMGL